MKKALVVAFAFGTPADIKSNKCIARFASRLARKLEAPVYTQRDVPIRYKGRVMYTDETHGNPPPTLRMARGAMRFAKELGAQEIWIVAAKPHLERCRRDIREAASEIRFDPQIPYCEESMKYRWDSWFCPDSTQKRTRSKDAWERRERILRLMPFFIYKHVAS